MVDGFARFQALNLGIAGSGNLGDFVENDDTEMTRNETVPNQDLNGISMI